ncbi:hypothetical protein M885DRAFT_498805 [Pelagophyceae sp. CCMP2097]|nr:hypothetical protein M885DRAFT_498805 [Pelagophyceae sp. CCMP2097]
MQNPGSVTMFSSANKLLLMPYDSPAGELSNQTASRLNSIARATLLFRSLCPIEVAVLRLAIPCLSVYRFHGGQFGYRGHSTASVGRLVEELPRSWGDCGMKIIKREGYDVEVSGDVKARKVYGGAVVDSMPLTRLAEFLVQRGIASAHDMEVDVDDPAVEINKALELKMQREVTHLAAVLCRELKSLKTNKDIMKLGHSHIPGGFRPTEAVGLNRKGGNIVSEKEEIFAFCHPHIFPYGMGDPNTKRLKPIGFDLWLKWIASITAGAAYKRRCANLAECPRIAVWFFHEKQKIFRETIQPKMYNLKPCEWWARYEHQ